MIPILRAVAWLTTRDTRATTTNKNAKNNVKAGKNALQVLNNNNSIQITKRKVKKRFTDGHLSSFTQFCHDAKNRSYWKHATSIASERKGARPIERSILALRLENYSLRYIMLCQDLDSKRPGDTVEEHSCPSCIGVAGPAGEFPKDI